MKNIFLKYHTLVDFILKLIPYTVIIFAGIITYRGILFSTGPAVQKNDIEMLLYPIYYFVRKSFIEGQVPLWDPYTMLGQPGLYSVGLALLYPVFLVFLSLKYLGALMPRHLELFMVWHIIFSGVAVYWGARKLGLGRLGGCMAGVVFQMAVIVKDTIYAPDIAFGIPWAVLAISYWIALAEDKGPIFVKNSRRTLIVVVTSLFFLISTTSPYLIIYTFMTFGIIMLFYVIGNIWTKNWRGIVALIKKSVLVCSIPILLNAFILLPSFTIIGDSVRQNVKVIRFGYLYIPHIWTLIFPRFGNNVEPPFAYVGVITLLLVTFYCITKINNAKNKGLIFIVIAIFWFYYAMDGSFLEKGLSCLPVLNILRLPQFALIIYAFAVSILAGEGLERIYKFKDCKIRFNINWIFPTFLIFALIFSTPHVIKELGHGFTVGNTVPLFFGYLFILYLIFQKHIKSSGIRSAVSKAIPFIVMLEIFSASPTFINKSEADIFAPYCQKIEKFSADFPECFLNKDIYRVDNFMEYTMLDYRYAKLSASGYCSVGTFPDRYRYLWDEYGRMGPRYEKWWLKAGNDKNVKPLSLDSKLYDLAGVKYFYLPEYEWLFIDYKKSGVGEWIEIELEDEESISGIGIYNPPNTAGGPDPSNKRRILEAAVVINGENEIKIKIPDEEGWHRFYFKPVKLYRVRIIAKEVVAYDYNQGSKGVVIGEVEFLDKSGNKIEAKIKNITASSTLCISNPSTVMDGRLGYVWESRCEVLAKKTLPNENLARIREGCYINKNVLPRAFMAHEYKYVKNETELLRELHCEGFEPGKEVLIGGKQFEYNLPNGPHADEVEILKYKLNQVEIKVKNDKPGFLILTDIYSPGWDVYVDNKKDELLIADGVFRGVYIKEGQHKIVFKYVPPFFWLGLFISLITFVLVFTVLCYAYLKRK